MEEEVIQSFDWTTWIQYNSIEVFILLAVIAYTAPRVFYGLSNLILSILKRPLMKSPEEKVAESINKNTEILIKQGKDIAAIKNHLRMETQ